MARVGRYELLGVVGRGGMATVYEAQVVGTNERVALKLIHETDREILVRFRREAEILERLGNEPHVVRCRDFGEERGRPFLVMELVKGGTLAEALRTGQISTRDALRALVLVARAVGAAHALGVVHRDLKPSNVLLREDGTPAVTDFGLAKDLKDKSLTQSGTIIGTFAFMAPEQIDPRRGPIAPPTDVYALGAMLYAIVAGRVVFVGAPTVIAKKILEDQPDELGSLRDDVDPRIAAVCRRALAKAPADRFPNATEFADALDEALAAKPERSRRGAGLVAAVVFGGALAAASFLAGRGLAPRSDPDATARRVLDGALARLRADEPLSDAGLAELEAAVAASPAALASDSAVLPFVRARSVLLRGDHGRALRDVEKLPPGRARALLEAEVRVARGETDAAWRLLGEAADERVPWSAGTACERWVSFAASVEGGAPARAAEAYVRGARELAARAPSDPRVGALLERAFALDPRVTVTQLGTLADVLARSATELLDRGEPSGIAHARRRLLAARLARPDDRFEAASAKLIALGSSARDEVRNAARPWGALVKDANDVERRLASGTEAEIDELVERIDEVTQVLAGVAASHRYEAYVDLVILRPEVTSFWGGLIPSAMSQGRFAESRLALAVCEKRGAVGSVPTVTAVLDALEKGAPLPALPERGPPGPPPEFGRGERGWRGGRRGGGRFEAIERQLEHAARELDEGKLDEVQQLLDELVRATDGRIEYAPRYRELRKKLEDAKKR